MKSMPKLNTQFIKEFRAKQREELKIALAKENAKIEKLHRNFSESILKEALTNNDLQKVLQDIESVSKHFQQLLDIYQPKKEKDNVKEWGKK